MFIAIERMFSSKICRAGRAGKNRNYFSCLATWRQQVRGRENQEPHEESKCTLWMYLPKFLRAFFHPSGLCSSCD